MALTEPILDDRSFDDLLQELIRRIPSYAPEWTDHNETDPGIVLLELFADLGETMLVRFNQIPEATKVAFLRLLGVQSRPAQQARTLLTVTTEQPDGVHLPKRTEARAGSVPFETEDDVHAWPLGVQALGKVLERTPEPGAAPAAVDQRRRQDAVARLPQDRRAQVEATQDARFYEVRSLPAGAGVADSGPLEVSATADGSLWLALLARTPQQIPALATGLSDASLSVGIALDEPTPAPPLSLTPTAGAARRGLSATELSADPPGMRWELWTPPGAGPPASLELIGDSTRGLTTTGTVKVALPHRLPAFPPAAAGDGGWDSPPPLPDPTLAARVVAWLRVRCPPGENDGIHAVRWVGVNAVGAVQARTATPELLGIGTGDPGQTYALTQRPVVPGSMQVEVEELDGWHAWTEVESLTAAGPRDAQYTLDPVAGLVRFGNRGRIPLPGQRIRVTSYRYGGGLVGNVPAGAIASVTGVAGVTVTNPTPATGGADPATLAEALEQIPAEVNRRDRVVTADDYAALARRVSGVSRAEALPLLHPDSPTHPAAGVVSLVVFPEEDLRDPAAPAPDVDLLRRVATYLNPRRPLASELYVIPPSYRKIAVSVGVRVRDGYPSDEVRGWVERILRQYLAPLPPFGPDGAGWPLGRAVRRAELEAVAVQVDGVAYLEGELRLARLDGDGDGDGEWVDQPGSVELCRWESPELAAIIVVRGVPPAPGGPLTPGGATPPVLVPLPPSGC